MKLDRSFGYLVHDVARLFARRFNQRAMLFLGLTRSQCRILGYLARHEGINQAGLADLLEIKPMTLVRHIDRMEEDGWIERHPDPADRRARRLMLTQKARPLLARILDLSTEIRREAFADLTEEEGMRLVELLGRVHGSLAEPALLAPVLKLPKTSQPASGHRLRRGSRAQVGWSAVGDHR